MIKLLCFVGCIVGSYAGWFLGETLGFGFLGIFLVSGAGSLAGIVGGWKLARRLD